MKTIISYGKYPAVSAGFSFQHSREAFLRGELFPEGRRTGQVAQAEKDNQGLKRGGYFHPAYQGGEGQDYEEALGRRAKIATRHIKRCLATNYGLTEFSVRQLCFNFSILRVFVVLTSSTSTD